MRSPCPVARMGRPEAGAANTLRAVCEGGLGLCIFLLPPLLALVPHAAAPLVAVAGICALGLIIAKHPRSLAALLFPGAILGLLLVWGGTSVAWSIDPGRSLLIAARLAGLFAAGLALAGAAPRLGSPRRILLAALAGTALGLVLAAGDIASAGGLTKLVSVRPFAGSRLDQFAAWAAIVMLPLGAVLVVCAGRLAGLLSAAGLAIAVCLLDDTTAKIALAAELPLAGLYCIRGGAVARLAAAVSVAAVLTAPVGLPALGRLPGVVAAADAFKTSAGHRLLIWSFTGDRIAERPFLGWGLDSARAIPGGKDEIRPGQSWLPLHTHDAPLQVWLELGAPGAALFALFVGWLWLRLAAAPCPRLYAAACGGSLAAALVLAFSAWGIWEEWWLATIDMALFAMLALSRVVASRLAGAAIPPPRRGWRGGGR